MYLQGGDYVNNEGNTIEPVLKSIAESLQSIAESLILLRPAQPQQQVAPVSDLRNDIKKLCTELVMAGKDIGFLKVKYKKISEIPEDSLISVWETLSKL